MVHNGPHTLENIKSLKRANINFSLVTNTVISRHSCKISREYFKFLKTMKNVPKIGTNIQHNAPSREMREVKFFLV